MEIHWFKVQTDWQQGELEIILDLGLPRRLDEVRLLTQSGKWGPERPLALLFAAKGENWQDAVFSLRVERPEGLSLDQLEEKFRHFNVAHLLYQKLPELDFIDLFLATAGKVSFSLAGESRTIPCSPISRLMILWDCLMARTGQPEYLHMKINL